MREVFNAIRYVVRTGCQWRMVPHDLPDWTVVYQQARRWMDAGVFEQAAHDLRVIMRLVHERDAQPSATILDGWTLQSTPESGDRAGYDGAKQKNGSKVHAAVDTLGNLLALKATVANEQEREQVAELAAKVQEITGGTVQIAFVDQGYTGDSAAQQAGGRTLIFKWSNTRKSRKVSYSCRDAGLSSARSVGSAAVGGWHETMSVWQR